MSVSCLYHPASKLRAPHYVVICGLSSSAMLPHYLKKGMIFGNKILNIKRVFLFSIKLLSVTVLLKKEFGDKLSQMYTSLHVRYSLFL
jgi:hypothetical protein